LLGPTCFGIFVSSKKMADSGALRVLVFTVGDLVCGLPAATAREVLPPQSATRIPGAPEAVLGLVNVRGSLLTLFDGHQLLGRVPDGSAEGAILVVDHGGRRAGLAVSEVSDLLTVAGSSIEAREALPGVDARFVRAVGHHEGRHFVMLDLPALLEPVFGA
jgi:purine-binding chemotaxis protein CheW